MMPNEFEETMDSLIEKGLVTFDTDPQGGFRPVLTMLGHAVVLEILRQEAKSGRRLTNKGLGNNWKGDLRIFIERETGEL